MSEDKSKRSLLSIVNPKRRSISRELTAGLIITIVVISAITMSLSYFNASRRAETQLENKASEYIVSLTNILEIPLWNLDKESVEGIGRSYAQNEFVQGLRIIDSWGEVYFQMEKEGDVPLVGKTSDVFHEGESIGHVELSLTPGYYEEISRQLLWSSGLTIIITLLSLIIMTGFLLRIFLRKPLKDLGEIVNSYASGKYDSSGHHMSYIEFQPFVAVLGEMGDRIKSQMTELRKHQEHLEELVEERTSDLKARTTDLEQANIEVAAINKELEAFAYSVSHDLRAPLRSIDGFSQALMEDYPDKLDEQGKGYLQRVRTATQRMGILIDDLLSLSRVTRSEMRREIVDLSTLAQSITEELQETQPERQVAFVIAPGLTTKGDAQLLHQLMENLLSNAWKFTGQHPKARIEFGVTQVNGKETLFIRDDGVGFDMTYADKLFGVFQRLHSQEEFPGTGVGLAIIQRIAHRHGGRVWAEGEVEKGATFYFTLD